MSEAEKRDLWQEYIAADINSRYWGYMARRFQTRDRWINIFLSAVSTGGVISWVGWKSLPWAWETLSVVTALTAIYQSFNSLGGATEKMFQINSEWMELEAEYRQLWNQVRSAPSDTSQVVTDSVLREFNRLQAKQVRLAAECQRLPCDDKKLSRLCYDEALAARQLPNPLEDRNSSKMLQEGIK